MDSLDNWRVNDEFYVLDAALLYAGLDPATVCVNYGNFEKDYPKFTAIKKALMNAVMSERLKAKILYKKIGQNYSEPAKVDRFTPVFPESFVINAEPDWEATTILLDDLLAWLSSRGVRDGFFFQQSTNPITQSTTPTQPDYLSPDNPCYAPKLAAAIHAWEHVTANPALLKGKTPKKALENWLRENASTYKLTKNDGSPNELGIEEAAKIANWKQDGGAPKTP